MFRNALCEHYIGQRLDDAKAIDAASDSDVLRGKSENCAGQRILVSSGNGRVALRATGLIDDPAGVAFGEPVLRPDSLDCLPAPFGAY